MSETYLEHNAHYWQKGYDAPNVESFVFRTYGRILKPDFGLSGAAHEKVLDFGCGAGANLAFFKRQGFDVYGVDISATDIARCRQLMPDSAEQFQIIDPQPTLVQDFPGAPYDLVIAIQSLYYLSDRDLDTCLSNLYRQMKPGALIYASMMGTRSYYYQHSKPARDGLRELTFPPEHRLQVSDYYLKFVADEAELQQLFSRFEKVQIGYYDACYREDEGSEFHYTFLGRKPLEAKD